MEQRNTSKPLLRPKTKRPIQQNIQKRPTKICFIKCRTFFSSRKSQTLRWNFANFFRNFKALNCWYFCYASYKIYQKYQQSTYWKKLIFRQTKSAFKWIHNWSFGRWTFLCYERFVFHGVFYYWASSTHSPTCMFKISNKMLERNLSFCRKLRFCNPFLFAT